jgi:hypothetical protein
MNTFTILGFLIGAPVLIYVWHLSKIGGNRPDPYHPIKDRPVIPAVVIDVDLPFASMVVLLFKLAVAAIPAVVLLTLVVLFLGSALTGGVLPRLLY